MKHLHTQNARFYTPDLIGTEAVQAFTNPLLECVDQNFTEELPGGKLIEAICIELQEVILYHTPNSQNAKGYFKFEFKLHGYKTAILSHIASKLVHAFQKEYREQDEMPNEPLYYSIYPIDNYYMLNILWAWNS